jgi:hypothetical protein
MRDSDKVNLIRVYGIHVWKYYDGSFVKLI